MFQINVIKYGPFKPSYRNVTTGAANFIIQIKNIDKLHKDLKATVRKPKGIK